ncbi:IS256 family transposase, partial [Collinsella aerofaciens]|uniref:IS256 family transposase n=1 Tax=Collinsella aerofaciens TaxID=74426 RepID=UPI00319E373B
MPQEESVLRLGRDEALEAARLWQECGDAREFACRVLGGVMNALMDSEAQQMCGAGRNERSDGRENSRNGYRPRSLKTAVGDVELEIPKLRHGTYYPEGMLARWSRVDTSVAAIVQEMYVCGVSTRKVERVASRLGISSLSSSEVSSLCSGLDAEVAEFRRRDLSGTPCCYLWLDATYMSCRVGSSVVSQGVVTAIGLGADGRKHFLGCDVVDTESEDSWAAFLGGLRERGLAGVRLVVSDSHAGLVAAVSRLFQGCAWQRCVTHLQRNLQSACSGRPEDSKAAVRDLVHAAVYQDDPDLARCVWAEAAPWVASVSARAGEVFEQAEDSALAFTAFPRAHWAKLRTNNVQERANREIKRRYRVVQSFPSRESMLRLTCAVSVNLFFTSFAKQARRSRKGGFTGC